MRLLLDTHLLIWAAEDSDKLSRQAAALMTDDANTPLFSTISLAEIAMKRALGRSDFAIDPALLRELMLANGYQELPLSGAHACAVGDLPAIHKDPFDRLLVAQAMAEGVTLLTADAVVAAYGGVVRRV